MNMCQEYQFMKLVLLPRFNMKLDDLDATFVEIISFCEELRLNFA